MRNTDPTSKPRRSVLVPFLIFLVLVLAGLYVMDNPRFAGSLGGLGSPSALTAPSPVPAASAAAAIAPAASQSVVEPPPATIANDSAVPGPHVAASQPATAADAIPLRFPSASGTGQSPGAAALPPTPTPPASSRGPSMMVPDAPQEKAAR